MTAPAGKFAPRSPDDIQRLVLEQPFAWIVSAGGETPYATPLPLRPVTAPDGTITRLIGHFARSNPHVEILRRDPRVLILLLGPHGYISPSWMQDRTQAPTWNYASAQFIADLRFTETVEETEALLRDLIGAMEDGRPKPWSQDEMGARYASLSRGIIGFEADIVETRAKFKLGQVERDDVFSDITNQLSRQDPSDDLLRWMRDFDQRAVK